MNITFHYNFAGGLTSSLVARERAEFSDLFKTVSSLIGLVSECNGVSISRDDIATSPPGESNVFFRIPMIFTAPNSIADDQVSSKLTSCINKFSASYKGILDAKAPKITEGGVTKRPSRSSSISDKESCCGGDTPPPCCAAGSTKVSSTRCGRYRCLHKQFAVSDIWRALSEGLFPPATCFKASWAIRELRGCLLDSGVTFIPARLHPGFLLWFCIVHMIPAQNFIHSFVYKNVVKFGCA